MYLFNRRTRIAPGKAREGVEWAASVTSKVHEVTGLEVSLWMTVMSPAVGTIAWNTVVETLSDLEAATAKLNADDIFMATAMQGSTLTDGSLDDTVIQLVYADIDPNARPSYAAVVQSQLANGSFRRGVECGIEIAQKATELSGLKTTFGMTTTGTYAGVGWITGADSLSELEVGEQKINSDPGFLELLDEKASSCYLPGATTQTLWQRVV
jgi:hypothetical protein